MPAILNFYTPQRHIPLICLKLPEDEFFTIATSEVEHWRPGELGVSSHIIAVKFLCSDCGKSLDRYDVISFGVIFLAQFHCYFLCKALKPVILLFFWGYLFCQLYP